MYIADVKIHKTKIIVGILVFIVSIYRKLVFIDATSRHVDEKFSGSWFKLWLQHDGMNFSDPDMRTAHRIFFCDVNREGVY